MPTRPTSSRGRCTSCSHGSRGQRSPTTIRFARSPHSRRGRPAPRSGFSAAPITGRGSRRISACRTRSPTSSAMARVSTKRSLLYRRNYRPSATLSAAYRDDLRVGACGRHRSGGAAALHDARILARRLRAGTCAIRWYRPSRRRRIPYTDVTNGRASTSCGARRSSAPPEQVAASLNRARAAARARRARRQHLDVRSGRAAPLVRASGSGVRALTAGMRGADALVRSLVNAGVRHVFTLSGNHIMSVFDAALDVGLDLVHTRHEAAAVHMADAWARITGEARNRARHRRSRARQRASRRSTPR